MSFGQRLRELREAADLSEAALAKEVGVSRNAVSQWETDTNQPATKHLSAIARALKVPADALLAPSARVRERIIDAATRHFDRIGYEETTLEVIAASADVGMGDLVALFETKQDLLYAVLKAYNDRTFADLRRIPAKYGSVDARMKQLLRMYYVHDLAHLKLTAAFHAFSWQWPETIERDNQRQLSDHDAAAIEILEQAVQDGEIRPGNFRAASQLIFAAYTASMRLAIFNGYDADRLVEYVEPQLQIILKGLGWQRAS